MRRITVERVCLKDTYGAPRDKVYFRREDGRLDSVQLVPSQALTQRDALGVYVAFLEWCKHAGYEVIAESSACRHTFPPMDNLPEIIAVRPVDGEAFVVDVVTDGGVRLGWPVTREEAKDELGAIVVFMDQWGAAKYTAFREALLRGAGSFKA